MSALPIPPAQPAAREMLPPAEILNRHPELTQGMLDTAGRRGSIYREPASRRGYFTYDAADSAKLAASRGIYRDEERADEITHEGKQLLLISSTRFHNDYHIARHAIVRWESKERGCWLLGEKPGLLKIRCRGENEPRDYVPIAFLDRFKKERAIRTRTEAELIQAGYRSFEQAGKLGFPQVFLLHYTNYDSPNRERQEKSDEPPPRREKTKAGQPKPPRRMLLREHHPVLNAFIEAKLFFVIRNDATDDDKSRKGLGWRPFVLLKDLQKITDAPPPNPAVWLDEAGLKREGIKSVAWITGYEGRPLTRLDGAELRIGWFWGKCGTGRKLVKYWLAAHVKKLAAELPKPANYVHEENGVKYVPLRAGAKIAGVKVYDLKHPGNDLFRFMNQPNPAWGGITVEGRTVDVKLHRCRVQKPWFVNLADCYKVRDFLKAKTASAAEGSAGLVLRSDDEYPLIDGKPAPRKLTVAEYDAIGAVLALHASGIARPQTEDIDDDDHPARTRILNMLAKDPVFSRFVSTPQGKKGKGFAILDAQLMK